MPLPPLTSIGNRVATPLANVALLAVRRHGGGNDHAAGARHLLGHGALRLPQVKSHPRRGRGGGRGGGAAKAVVPDMLPAVVKTAEPLEPISWADPIQFTQGELAAVLFKDLPRPSSDGVDPALLHPAIRAVSRNADGMARATPRHLLEHQLTAEDVQALGPDIVTAVMIRCPADTMFGNEIRMGAFKALTKPRGHTGRQPAAPRISR